MEKVDNIPTTAIFSVRADVRDIACIAQAFDLMNIDYKTKTGLVRLVLRNYSEILADTVKELKGIDVLVPSTEAAMRYVGLNSRLDMKIEIGDTAFRKALTQKLKENSISDLNPSSTIKERADALSSDDYTDEVDDDGIPIHLK